MPSDNTAAVESSSRVRDSVLVATPTGGKAAAAKTSGGKNILGKPPTPPRNAGEEVARLNALVGEHESRARKVKAQIATLQKHCQTADADNARIRSELRSVREELARTQKELNMELGIARQRETDLGDQLAGAREEVVTRTATATRNQRIWLCVTSVVVVGTVASVTFLYSQSGVPQAAMQHDTQLAENVTVKAAARAVSPPAEPAPPPKPPDFTGAISHLDESLKRFKTEKPEDVMRQAQIENAARGISVCSFEWNRGQPSLLFGSGSSSHELESAVGLCADAVDELAKKASTVR